MKLRRALPELKRPLPPNTLVCVCAECHQASCWLGVFMCSGSRDANIVHMTVAELRKQAREHEDYWFSDLELAMGYGPTL